MTTTPVSKSKLYKEGRVKTAAKKDNDSAATLQSLTTTPSTKNGQLDSEDYSPIYFPLTQESNEEIDVYWDWHSPQTSQRKRKKQKRLIPVQSPKFPVKRCPSNNQMQNFERLKQELKLFQEELAQPDDESCLCVSPQQEQEIKRGESNNLVVQPSQPPNDEFDDLFNDSIDEQLVLFSQTIENEMAEKKSNENTKETELTLSNNLCDTTSINDLINKYSGKANEQSSSTTSKNTFDNFQLGETLSFENTQKRSKFAFQRTLSDHSNAKSTENFIQTASGKLEFHRTKSFELAGLNSNSTITKTTMEEIERKRLEAKAKLEAKRNNFVCNKSPIKCSPEEIEKKRLQALAKLEAKRIQDIIEKKRQEALKKLQISRMKNASQVKSSLTTRL